MVRVITLALATTALVGCATQAPPPPPPVAEVAPAAPAPAPLPPAAPKPTYGTFGFDTAGMDKSVAPGDDFFTYANGTWVKNTPIPPDKARYGMFNVLDDLSRERTRTIIEDQAKDPNSKIGNAYAAFMDEAAIESKGLTPLDPWLSKVRGLKSKAGLAALYAEAEENGVSGPFRMFVAQDRKAPDQYILQMSQSGIGMPDRDYYLSTDPKLVETRAKYLQHLTNVLTLAGEKNAALRAKAILALETRIAKAHWVRADSRDATKTYNKMTVAQLAKRAPGFNFAGLIHGIGANVNDVVVSQPSAFTGEAAAINSVLLSVLDDQLLVRSIDSYAAYLPKRFDDERFSFYGTVLSGTPEQEARWKRAVDF